MGLEALSRGAATCCFFEREAVALAALKQNVAALGVAERAAIVARDAWQAAVADPRGTAFDLVLLDPPYADTDDASAEGLVARYLVRLVATGTGEQLVLLHHRAAVRCWLAAGGWDILDRRNFGSNGLTIFHR